MGSRLPVVRVRVADADMARALLAACRSHGVDVQAVPILMAQSWRETGFQLETFVFGYAKDGEWDSYHGDYISRYATEWLPTEEKDAALARLAPRTDAGGQPGGSATGPNVAVPGTRNAKGQWYVQLWPDHPWCRFRAAATLDAGASAWLDVLTGRRYRAALALAELGDSAGYVIAVGEAGYYGESLASYRRGYDEAVPRMRAVVEKAYKTMVPAIGADRDPKPENAMQIDHEWADVECAGFRYRVSRDAVKTGGIRQSYSPAGIAKLCAELDVVAPVPELLDARFMAAGVQNLPAPQNIRMPRAEAIRQHNVALDVVARVSRILGNAGKHHCYPLEKEEIYGWHLLTESTSWMKIPLYPCVSGLSKLRVIQRVSRAHSGPDDTKIDGAQDDYSMTAVVVHEQCVELATGATHWTQDTPIYRARAVRVDDVPGPHDIEPVTGTPLDITRHRVLRLVTPLMRGEDVATVQRAVGTVADGIYGPGTSLAVRIWQQARGLVADGVFGPASWVRLAQAAPAPEAWVVTPALPLGERALAIARAEQAAGVREVPGASASPRILEYFAGCERDGKIIGSALRSDEEAWCAASASWCMVQALLAGEAMPHRWRASVRELWADAVAGGIAMTAKRIRSGELVPQIGDLWIGTRGGYAAGPEAYPFALSGGRGHVGRIASWKPLGGGQADVTTLDGNINNQWWLVTRAASASEFVGVIRYPRS